MKNDESAIHVNANEVSITIDGGVMRKAPMAATEVVDHATQVTLMYHTVRSEMVINSHS